MSDLKPCPFCGGDARHQQSGPRSNKWWECVCDKCDFCGPAGYTEPEAIAAWNTRSDLIPQWQPIETAPKDGGNHILGLGDGDAIVNCTYVMVWDDDLHKFKLAFGTANIYPYKWMRI